MITSFTPTATVSRRTLAAGGILMIHVLVAYLWITGFRLPLAPHPDADINAFVMPPAEPVPTTPTPLVNVGTPQRPTIPEQPVPDLQVDAAPDATPISAALPHEPDMFVAAGAKLPIRTLGRNVLPDAESYYPPELRRLGVQGATDVNVCVDPSGVRAGEPQIRKSSGNERLDQGALNVARHGRYARSVQGDRPVANCFEFRIVFRLNY
jgi:TonB family protein